MPNSPRARTITRAAAESDQTPSAGARSSAGRRSSRNRAGDASGVVTGVTAGVTAGVAAEAASTMPVPAHDAHGQHAHTEPGYIHQKDAQLKRLRRIEGQVRGLHRMVENDTYCIDILTQVSAATKALEAVALGLLDDHLKHCLVDAAVNPSADLNAKLDEASAAIGRLVRS